MTEKKSVSYFPYDDYAQSANTLFHFMRKPEYLKWILQHHAIAPRYCVENVEYLNIHIGDRAFREIAVLQKCFCDIPFHKLADSFPLNGEGENFKELLPEEKTELEKRNTHFDYYGEYAIAFSKSWGEVNNLQPIHYLNQEAQYANDFRAVLENALSEENLPEQYVQDVINRLAYMKPLRGLMKRKVQHKGSGELDVELYKNFHDEREWRYVPKTEKLTSVAMESVIANPKLIALSNRISEWLEMDKYKALWLDFSYDDIRYIIVPNLHARIDMIQEILSIPKEMFSEASDVEMQKHILISKILVLNEIRRDW